jgi:hypothetical protein
MLHRLVPVALFAAAIAPAGALAQEVRTSAVPVYSFVQLSVTAGVIAAADFKARTEAIGSCAEARELGKALGARINNGDSVMANLLPSELRPILAKTPTGKATPVLVEQGTAMHVVVICHRS